MERERYFIGNQWMQRILFVVLLAFTGLTLLVSDAQAASARELDVRVDEALQRFYEEYTNGRNLASQARGVLVFPKVYKAGFGLGGEYGQGALRVHGRTVDYYSIKAASYGIQFGAQRKAILLFFMDDAALSHFRNSSGWNIGAGASIAFLDVGAEDNINSKTYNKPIIGFVMDQKGLMADVSLEGAKFSKLDKN